MTMEKNPVDIEALLARQKERLADKAPSEGLAAKIERVKEAGMKADAEREAAKAAERAIPEPDGPFGTISAWIPEPDPHIRATVGKLGEECSELAKVCFRISISGIDAIDPDSGRTNREELYKELADVMGAADLLDILIPQHSDPMMQIDIMERRTKKRNGFLKWHGLIRDHFDALRRAAGMKAP